MNPKVPLDWWLLLCDECVHYMHTQFGIIIIIVISTLLSLVEYILCGLSNHPQGTRAECMNFK